MRSRSASPPAVRACTSHSCSWFTPAGTGLLLLSPSEDERTHVKRLVVSDWAASYVANRLALVLTWAFCCWSDGWVRCVAAAPVAQRVIKEVGWRSMMGQMGWVVSHTIACIAGTWVAFCQECQQRSCGQEAVCRRTL